MEKNIIMTYQGCEIILTTKHRKNEVIAPVFKEILSAEIKLCELDTDNLGTFSGENARIGTAEECVIKKCEWGLNNLNGLYGLASEGSFGPHPFMPFVPSDHELLYFIDQVRQFHVVEKILSPKTNYNMIKTSHIDELYQFLEKIHFPSHAIIIRPNACEDKFVIFKGIQSQSDLEESFSFSLKKSEDQMVWVETDMRAHMNPTRMEIIRELSQTLAMRLANACPSCCNPGFGKVRTEFGLEYDFCGEITHQKKHEVHGCVKCDYTEIFKEKGDVIYADPKYCPSCNP